MNDSLNDILKQMAEHKMSIPPQRVSFQIPDARNILFNYLSEFLSLDGAKPQWLPEYEKVAEWLTNNNGRGLFLFGDCGRGKSLLSRFVIPAILLRYMEKIVSVYDVQEMNKKLDEVLKKHILCIDDIGTEEISVEYGNKRLAFAEVMDAVEKHGKLIIISTNLTGPAIEKQYGKRVMERIIATTKRIEFKGRSLRR